MTSDFEGFLYQILSITLFSYLLSNTCLTALTIICASITQWISPQQRDINNFLLSSNYLQLYNKYGCECKLISIWQKSTST